MSELTRESSGFVGYEYKDISVKRDMEAVYADGYSNFGWELDGTTHTMQGVASSTMKFKRDRKIKNKAELTRLQRQFEGGAKEIERLESSKTVGAAAAAYGLGIIGTAFMAGSVFAYLGGMLPLCIVLAVPGFLGWIVPYFGYVRLRGKKTERVTPLIDQQYDAIYDACEKGNALLAN